MSTWNKILLRGNLITRITNTLGVKELHCSGKDCTRTFKVGDYAMRHSSRIPRYFCKKCYEALWVDIPD